MLPSSLQDGNRDLANPPTGRLGIFHGELQISREART